MKSRILFLSIISCLLLLACQEGEVNNKYCNLRARLHVENVSQAPALFTACESMGEFCTIKLSNNGLQLLCKDATEHPADPINITAISAYGSYFLGLSGFIVGKPTIPEIGEDFVHVVCYDLACSNCYQDYHFTKDLRLQAGGYAKCTSCGRTYDLNDYGNITAAGPGGRPLFRYRVNYVSGILLISNG